MPWLTTLALALAVQSSTAGQIDHLIGELGPKPFMGDCGVANVSTRKFSKPLRASDRLVNLGVNAVEPLLRIVGKPSDWKGANDRYADKRSLAIETLGRIGDPRAIDPIGQVLRHHPGAQERTSAAIALADLKAKAYADEVVATFGDHRSVPSSPHMTVGEYVALSMAPYGQAAHAAVRKAFRSPSEEVRMRAIQAAETLAIPAIAEDLVSMAKTSSADLQRAAVYALGRCGNAESVPALLPYLEAKDDYLAVTAAQSLGRLRPHSVVALTELQRSPQARMRRLSLYALCHWNYGRPDLFQLVRKSFADPAPEVRWQAIQILGYQSDIGSDDQQRLQKLAKDPSIRVRTAAREVLNLVKNNTRIETSGYW